MPETLASATGAVVLLAVLVAVCDAAVRRLGTGPAPDPVSVGLRGLMDVLRAEPAMLAAAGGDAEEEQGGRRRGLFRRRRGKAGEPDAAGEEHDGMDAAALRAEPEPAAPEPEGAESTARPEPEPEPEEEPLATTRPALDHVPFGGPGDDTDDYGDGERRWRERLRTGMRKTRDYLNRDVREVFGPGPIPETFDALEEILVRADVGVATATALSDELRERGRELTSDTLPDAFRETMRSYLHDADRRLRVNVDGVSVWMIVGVNGTGKTTSIAKLARHASVRGFNVLLAAADTFRAAAIEQLEAWGERIGVRVIRQQAGSDPAAVVFDAVAHAKARNYDLVVVDTAGRLHTKQPLMEELKKVRRVIEKAVGRPPDETLLVLDATTGQNGIAQARAFTEAVDVTGVALTKFDGTAKGGVVLAVRDQLGVPVKVVGTGEAVGDLEPFDGEAFAARLLDG